jgi:hypothetical protein
LSYFINRFAPFYSLQRHFSLLCTGGYQRAFFSLILAYLFTIDTILNYCLDFGVY